MGLLKSGHLKKEEAREIIQALLEIRDGGLDELDEKGEDVHEAIEKAVTKRTPAGKKMHTARSRNDEIATCLRMFARDRLLSIAQAVLDLRKVLIEKAEEYIDVIMPGFTHLQYAQPTRLSHHILAYHDMLKRDFDRLISAFSRTNLSPLGSCAFAGTSLEIDRIYTAKLLGFEDVLENSADAVSSRDFLIESIFASSSTMLTLSRIAEEIILWSSEFDFVDLPEEFASTSSIMPHKKNPDVAELIRAKAGTCLGNLVSAMSIYKGLPLNYNRDFQEMNNLLYSTLSITEISVVVMTDMLSLINFKTDVMVKKVSNSSFACEIVERLTRMGVPFRDAHRIVGRAIAEGKLKVIKERYNVDVDLKETVERKSLGGTSKSEVIRMIKVRKDILERDLEIVNEKVDKICSSLERIYREVEVLGL